MKRTLLVLIILAAWFVVSNIDLTHHINPLRGGWTQHDAE